VNGFSTTVGGVFDKALSSVFPAAGHLVGNAANVMGGVLSQLTNGAISGANAVTGGLNQVLQGKAAIGTTTIMAGALNAASSGIYAATDLVGGIMQSVSAASSAVAQTTEDFGTLIRRMTTSNSAKPTPLEGFVTMVTKQDAKGSTAA
jgi:ABC-type transporter Mla subunit MlaD